MRRLQMVLGSATCGALVLGVAAWGQERGSPPAEVLTVERAVALALENNRPLKNAGLEVGKATDRIAAARTRRLPELQFGLTEGMLVLPIELEFRRGDFGTFPGVGPIPAEDTTLRTPRKLTTSVTAKVAQPLSQLYRLTLGIGPPPWGSPGSSSTAASSATTSIRRTSNSHAVPHTDVRTRTLRLRQSPSGKRR